MLKIKRVYEAPENSDGFRVLVDRLWARGESKEQAKLDHWAKEIAPSTKVRKSFGHEVAHFKDFEKNYINELNTNESSKDFLKLIEDQLKLGNVTLLYGAKNEELNNAVVLKKWLEEHLEK